MKRFFPGLVLASLLGTACSSSYDRHPNQVDIGEVQGRLSTMGVPTENVVGRVSYYDVDLAEKVPSYRDIALEQCGGQVRVQLQNGNVYLKFRGVNVGVCPTFRLRAFGGTDLGYPDKPFPNANASFTIPPRYLTWGRGSVQAVILGERGSEDRIALKFEIPTCGLRFEMSEEGRPVAYVWRGLGDTESTQPRSMTEALGALETAVGRGVCERPRATPCELRTKSPWKEDAWAFHRGGFDEVRLKHPVNPEWETLLSMLQTRGYCRF